MFKENNTQLTKYLSMASLVLVFFSSQVFGCRNLSYLPYIAPLFGLGALYALLLILQDVKKAVSLFKTSLFGWILGMNILIFVRGYILGPYPDAYSRSSQILVLSHLMVVVVILWMEQERASEILTGAAVGMLVAESIFVIIYNRSYISNLLSTGVFERIGETPNAGLIETSMTISFCTIPLIFSVICKKKYVYIPALILALFVLVMNGSKVGAMVVMATLFVIAVGYSNDKKIRWRNLIVFVVAVIGIAIISYVVPVLREAIFSRFQELIQVVVTMDTSDMQNSTSRRLYFAIMGLTTTWDEPLIGHGFLGFGVRMGFDWWEGVWPDTHNNGIELLYSCGLIGIALYYWFPIYMIVKSIKERHSVKKLAMISIIIMMVCFDLCNISFQRNTIGYIAFTTVYVLTLAKNQFESDKE